MEFYLISNLFSLGFFGGFSHCIGMCGPFVITQVGNNLQKTSLINFNFFTRLKNCALIPYHLGRILSYSFIAFISKLILKSFDDTRSYHIFSAILLIIGAIFFLKILFEDNNFLSKLTNIFVNFLTKFTAKFFGNNQNFSNQKLLKKLTSKIPKIIFFKFFYQKFLAIIKFLFANPRGINGFILGIILGFLPCGLIFGAVAITLNFSSPFFSAIGMMIFGLSTFVALFFTGYFGGFILKIKSLKYFTKFIIFLNIVTLLMLAVKQILL